MELLDWSGKNIIPTFEHVMYFCSSEEVWENSEYKSLSSWLWCWALYPFLTLQHIQYPRWRVLKWVGGGSWSRAPLGQGQTWAQPAPVTSSSFSPQFGDPESLLRLLLMVQERVCGFPLKVSEFMENLHRDADKQEPWWNFVCVIEHWPRAHQNHQQCKYWICSWICVGVILAKSLAIISMCFI